MSDVYEALRQAALQAIRAQGVDLDDADEVRSMLTRLVEGYQIDALSGRGHRPLHDTASMVERLSRSLLEHGPLTPFLDGSIDYEELIIHGDQVRFVDHRGRFMVHDEPVSEAEVVHVIGKLLASVGATVDEARPMIQTQVLDGSARLGVVIPPVADRIDVSLRRYRTRRETFAELIEWDALTPAAASLLTALVRTPTGVIVTGQPSAGKTTLVNAMLRSAPRELRVIACEDTPELSVDHLGAARWRTRPSSPDGAGRVTLRDLVRLALGMRPDLIVLGELRGDESYELTRAGNAGCGVVSTIHANGARQGLQALVSTAAMAGPNVQIEQVRHVLSSVVDVFVHVAREPSAARADGVGGRRRVMEIVAVPPLQGVEVEFTVEPLFTRDDFGSPLQWTGARLPADLEQRVDRALWPLGTTSQVILDGRRDLT